MPTTSSDQGITLPVDGDAADAPVMMTSYNAGVEPRLNRRYTNLAQRTTNYGTSAVGDQTFLQAELRQESFNGTNHISLFVPSNFAYLRKAADQTLTSNSTANQDVTSLVAALPTAGSFGFEVDIFHDSTTVADMKFAFTWPAAVTARWGVMGLATGAAGTTGDMQGATASASDSSISVAGAGAGTIIMTTLKGEIVMGGTAGNLQLRAAQATAEVSTAIVRAGSRMRVWRFA